MSVAAAIRLAIRISSSRSRTRNGSFSMDDVLGALLRRAGAGLLVDRLDEVLADAGRHLFMDREQPLAPLSTFLIGELDELGIARGLVLGQRLLVLLLGDRV